MLSGFRAEAIGDFPKALIALISSLTQTSPNIATQLMELQKTLPALRIRSSTTGHSIEQINQEDAGPQLMTDIDEFPTSNRAGMYIYLEASVKLTRPMSSCTK